MTDPLITEPLTEQSTEAPSLLEKEPLQEIKNQPESAKVLENGKKTTQNTAAKEPKEELAAASIDTSPLKNKMLAS